MISGNGIALFCADDCIDLFDDIDQSQNFQLIRHDAVVRTSQLLLNSGYIEFAFVFENGTAKNEYYIYAEHSEREDELIRGLESFEYIFIDSELPAYN